MIRNILLKTVGSWSNCCLCATRMVCDALTTTDIKGMNHFAKDCTKLVELLPAWFGLFLQSNSHGL